MPASVVWIGWLVLFLVYEIYAAAAPPLGDTLSENVWNWFGVKAGGHLTRRSFLAVFMLTLTSHFVLGQPGGGAIIATGLPVTAVILYSTFRRK